MTNTTKPLTDTKEIAKRIRADIAAAIKSGELPQLKVSVRIKYSSMSSSITLEVVETPHDFLAVNAAHEWWTAANPRLASCMAPESARDRLSPAGRHVIQKLSAIAAAYNWDRSDRMIDHFNVNFYQHVHFHSDLLRAQREALAAA
jgi:hypothetical protein